MKYQAFVGERKLESPVSICEQIWDLSWSFFPFTGTTPQAMALVFRGDGDYSLYCNEFYVELERFLE